MIDLAIEGSKEVLMLPTDVSEGEAMSELD